MRRLRRFHKCHQNFHRALLNRYGFPELTRDAFPAIAARGMQPLDTRPFSQAVDAHTLPSVPETHSLSIKILADGKEVQELVQRSFPKANPSKLQNGLSRLLSDAQLTTIRDPFSSRSGIEHKDLTQRQTMWTLCTNKRAIHRSVLVRKNDLQKLEEMIEKAADEIGHHPHIAHKAVEGDLHVTNILCTTHHPTGLSMRDVRLADRIDEITQQLRDTSQSTPLKLDDEQSHIALTLLEDNLRAADAAIANPDSMCSVHESPRSGDQPSTR